MPAVQRGERSRERASFDGTKAEREDVCRSSVAENAELVPERSALARRRRARLMKNPSSDLI
jgi:hypothetical protein